MRHDHNPLHQLPMKMDSSRALVFDNHIRRSWVATVYKLPLGALRSRGYGYGRTPLITLLGCRPDLDRERQTFRLNSRDFATLDCDSDPCFRASIELLKPSVDMHPSVHLTVQGLCVGGFRVDHASYNDTGPATRLIAEDKLTLVEIELRQHPRLVPFEEVEDGWPDEAYDEWRGL